LGPTSISFSEWFAFLQGELFLFAAVFFLIGALDEIAVDLAYIMMRFSGHANTQKIIERPDAQSKPLSGMAAVFIPTWQEAPVIGATLRHALAAWKHPNMRIYIGCYRNDPATLEAVMAASGGDPRLRLVIHDRAGPSSKADCLNRLYGALQVDEQRMGEAAHMVVLHDAEDMVDPLALAAMDEAIETAEFVQIPVLALPQPGARWIAGHYSDEFAEAHAKTMVVRHALGAGIPGAGVGCAIVRDMLRKIVDVQEAEAEQALNVGPFPVDSLTEDYELGLCVKALGGRDKFLRLRTETGRLIATRAYFPAKAEDAIRQKTRWIQGIALQGWDRMGWQGSLVQKWMQMRDRRGPFAAGLMACAYGLIVLSGLSWIAARLGWQGPIEYSPILWGLLAANLTALAWRSLMRFAFTAREYGLVEGLCSIPRMFISNLIAILAGRRAMFAYIRSLRGAPLVWDKTPHKHHPSVMKPRLEQHSLAQPKLAQVKMNQRKQVLA
jgi:adsorption protein B